jgi:integrase
MEMANSADLTERKSVHASATAGQSDLPSLTKIAEECFADIGREKKWTEKTEAARRAHISLCVEIIGDKPLNAYTQHDMRFLKQTLSALPPNAHARKEFRLLTKVKIAEKAKAMGVPGLSVESIRQIMTAASMVYGWASAHYDKNLPNIVHQLMPLPSSGGDKNGKRHVLTIGDLQKLFEQPVFTGVKSDTEWLKSGSVMMRQSGRFWIPLLSIFTGVRLMEAVQLTRDDVGCEDGIWFIDINEDGEDGGKRVKNRSSVRRIPLHQQLIELGFLDFVQTVSPRSRLFPDIKIGPATHRHMHASKAFNKLLLTAGVKNKRKVWHSLRHSFEQACRDSRVDSAVMDQLQGHAQKGMRAVYGEGYKLAALNEGIQSVRYKGLNLGHITPFKLKLNVS